MADNTLETHVLDILKKIGCSIDEKEVEAVHRLSSQVSPKKVIIKLSKRKDVIKVLNKKKELKDKDLTDLGIENTIYINESLCREYKLLWNKCKSLKSDKDIHSFWVSYGTLKIRTNSDSKPSNIGHISDLRKLFPSSKALADYT